MRSCDGFTCRRLDRISFGFGGKRYADGVKFCSTCGRFLKIDGYKCPCCKGTTRSRSHTRKWRKNSLYNVSSCLTENIKIEKIGEKML